jgi:hypothetical protein
MAKRELTWAELSRFQLTGILPDWYEVQTEVKAKAKTETKPKVDVQPTDKA